MYKPDQRGFLQPVEPAVEGQEVESSLLALAASQGQQMLWTTGSSVVDMPASGMQMGLQFGWTRFADWRSVGTQSCTPYAGFGTPLQHPSPYQILSCSRWHVDKRTAVLLQGPNGMEEIEFPDVFR